MMQRNTTQREAIREVFNEAGRPLSVPEAFDQAQQHVPSLGTATVYRAVKTLSEAGFLTEVTLPGEPTRYELAALEHHHHFHCDICGRVFDVEGCPGKIGQLAPPGFSVRSHEIILYGTCAECEAQP